MRAAAALIVVVFHIQGELRHRGFADPFPDLTVGAFGVDLFFVVSGFIMVYASATLFGTKGAGPKFLLKRIARIAPLYWVFTAIFAVIAVVLGRLPGHPQASSSHILASFLFVPAARPDDGAIFPVYSLGWTLNYEMFFYLCFALTIGLRRPTAVAVLSAGLVALVLAGTFAQLPWPLAYWASPLTLEFVFGMGIATAYLSGLRLPIRAAAALAAVALVAVLLYVPFIDSLADWRGLAWGIPAAGVVAAATGVDVRGRSGPARLGVVLGDASYSLYLVHSALFIAAFSILGRIVDPHVLPPLVYAAVLLLGSGTSAVLLFQLFEKPVTRRLHRMIGRGVGARRNPDNPDLFVDAKRIVAG